MALQDQIEELDVRITSAESAIVKAGSSAARASRYHIKGLRQSHDTLMGQVEELYAELDVGEAFPDIQAYGLEFARVLVMAYDAKCIARQKITGRFFEWDVLDRAVGGKGHALGACGTWGARRVLTYHAGTEQHQRVVKGMQKRQPALVNAINRYNDLCARLVELLPRGMSFALPQPLTTELAKLKDDPTLLEDVWMSTESGEGTGALWLMDSSVRKGIRAVHLLDRCREEVTRLDMEERSLHAWLLPEINALDAAIANPDSTRLASSHALADADGRLCVRVMDALSTCAARGPAYGVPGGPAAHRPDGRPSRHPVARVLLDCTQVLPPHEHGHAPSTCRGPPV